MKKEYQDVISEQMGVEPVKINSALVSAQNRERLYWSNIPYRDLQNYKNIVIRDILEINAPDDYDINSEIIPRYMDDWGKPKGYSSITGKSKCFTASMHKGYGNDGCTVLDKFEIIKDFVMEMEDPERSVILLKHFSESEFSLDKIAKHI